MNEYAMTATQDRQKIVLVLLLAFGVRVAASLPKEKTGLETFTESVLTQNIPAWLIMVGIILTAADFESTRDLALAMALLILFATLLTNALTALEAGTRFMDEWTSGTLFKKQEETKE